MKNLTTHGPNSMQSYFPYSTLTSTSQGCACTRTLLFLELLWNVHAKAFSSPKETILHLYRNEIITVNQLQLNYLTNMHLLIPQFINSFYVITINTLIDVQMTVGGAF